MTAAEQQKKGGGLLSKLIIVVLLAVAIGLYLQIVMIDGERLADQTSKPQISVPIVEGDEPTETAQTLEALPEDQQALIIQVFAPEMLGDAGSTD